jgi:predicted HicB family RNase H-like nuclease
MDKTGNYYFATVLEPDPVTNENYNGKFLVRLPKTLHAKLTIEAKKEGVSLNQYALYNSCYAGRII